jgi:hypothetical protein
MAETKSFAVPMPEIGPGVSLEFDLKSIASIQKAVGGDDKAAVRNWLATVLVDIDTYSVTTIELLLSHSLKGADVKFAPWSIPIDTICRRLADALMLRLYGMTVEQKNAERVSATQSESSAG